MNKFKFISIIIMIFFQTGNVLSNEGVFTVNNIEVNKNTFKNKAELIDIAFKKGFEKLNSKILLERDYKKLKKTNLRTIKNLVSHYQMTNNSELSKNNVLINLFFKRDKMYNFYSLNNIKYSDVRGKSIKILPVLLLNNEIFIYENNFFYENWLSNNKKEKIENKNIEYSLPLENLEVIEKIKKNQNNLEELILDDIFDENLEKDNLLIIIDFKEKRSNIFLKGNISSKLIVKNLVVVDDSVKKFNYQNIMLFLKKEILEIMKSQNVIDIRTPSFLKIKLNFEKKNDLYLFQNILYEIDLIESFNIREFNNKYAYIRVKYFGKTNIIKEKLLQKGLDLKLDDNEIIAKVR